MIPKRAIFYWDSGEEMLPALRAEGIASFKRMNPEWEVVVLRRDRTSPVESFTTLGAVLASDLARYRALHELGGVYFDTDIIFIRPFPEVWLEGDVALTVTTRGQIFHVAMMGSVPGSPFFKMAEEMALRRLSAPGALGYQSLGVVLFKDINLVATAEAQGIKMIRLPNEAVIGIKWFEAEKVLDPPENGLFEPPAIGLHWYGGDWAIRDRGTAFGKGIPSDSALAMAIEMSGGAL